MKKSKTCRNIRKQFLALQIQNNKKNKKMEGWRIEEIISANCEIDENGFPDNAQEKLDVLWKKFEDLKKGYLSASEQYKKENKEYFLEAQKTFCAYSARVSYFLVHGEEPMQTDVASQSDAQSEKDVSEIKETKKEENWLSYSQCQKILKPIMSLESGSLTKDTMNRIHSEIENAQAIAQTLDYEFGELEQVIIALVHDKLDAISKGIWEYKIRTMDPTFSVLMDFLEVRSEMVEAELKPETNAKAQSFEQLETGQRAIWCAYCKATSHTIFKCEYFDTLTIRARTEFLQRDGRCFNCLSHHGKKPCPSGVCRTCNQPHNSLICARNPKNLGLRD